MPKKVAPVPGGVSLDVFRDNFESQGIFIQITQMSKGIIAYLRQNGKHRNYFFDKNDQLIGSSPLVDQHKSIPDDGNPFIDSSRIAT